MSDSDQVKKLSLADMFNVKCPDKINHDDTIIVVEDQQDMRLIVSSHLNKMGYKSIHQAQNGYDALEFLRETDRNVSVIVCDIEMPVMDGYTLLGELRESTDIDRPPFAITMDNPQKEKIMFALESGVDEVMVKPFSLNDIFPKIQSAFKSFHNPNNPEKVYELAKKSLRSNDLESAEKIYTAISQSNKKVARPYVGLARVAMQKNNLDDALKFLAEAESKNKHYVHIFALRGQVFTKQGDINKAVEAFTHAIELSPLNPLRYEEAAKPLFMQKKYDEGLRILNIALDNELSFPSLHHYLSEGYFAVKQFDKAIKHIRVALNDDQDNVVYLNQLGISLKESNELDEAMKVYNSIIKIDNDNKAAYYNKAILQFSMSKIEDSVKTLERIIGKFPDFEQAKRKFTEYKAALDKPSEGAA